MGLWRILVTRLASRERAEAAGSSSPFESNLAPHIPPSIGQLWDGWSLCTDIWIFPQWQKCQLVMRLQIRNWPHNMDGKLCLIEPVCDSSRLSGWQPGVKISDQDHLRATAVLTSFLSALTRALYKLVLVHQCHIFAFSFSPTTQCHTTSHFGSLNSDCGLAALWGGRYQNKIPRLLEFWNSLLGFLIDWFGFKKVVLKNSH